MISTKSTKKGAASLYVVIFTTLILGVVVASFVRLVVSEIARTSSTDLSQSAYDSALAGVEDAKAAILALNGGALPENWAANCNQFVKDSTVSRPIDEDGTVIIKENQTGKDIEAQAYTCVTIAKNLTNYKTTIGGSDNEALAVVRINPRSAASGVQIQWSPARTDNLTETNEVNFQAYDTAKNLLSYATLEVGLTNDFDTVNGTSSPHKLILYPTTKDHSSVDGLTQVKCQNQNYFCEYDYAMNLAAGSVAYLVISLPYSQHSVELNVSAYNKGADNTKTLVENDFSQFIIDSTGRANDYYRRVETYVSYGDGLLPAPQYTVAASGDGSDGGVRKRFYVTNNCWLTIDSGNDIGTTKTCNNSGEIPTD